MNEEKKQPLISIIVPVFHVEKELPRCMKSLLNQTERNIEIILVDDGSDDGCPALCDSYAAQDVRVQVVHKPNGGLSDARNAGMVVMQGKWCLFVDSDDYIEVDACERLLIAAQKVKNADIVVGECEEHHGDTSVFQRHTNLAEGKLYSAPEYMKLAIGRSEFFMPAWLNLYRTVWLNENGFQFAKGLLHEDLEWSPRIFLAEPRVTYMKNAFYHYVIRDGSICRSKDFSKNIADSMSIFREWKELFALVTDTELQRLLNGFLCKSFIHVCAIYQIRDGISKCEITHSFLITKSIGLFGKLTAILYSLAPYVYCKIYKITHKLTG